MSTKIYGAFNAHMDLYSIFILLNKIRKKIIAYSYSELLDVAAKAFFDVSDMFKTNAEGAKDNPWGMNDANDFSNFTYNFIEKIEESERGIKRTCYDTSSTVCVYPVDKEKTIIQIFCNNHKIYDYISKQFIESGFSDFSYWNNVDSPDDVEEEAWEDRKRIWNKIMPSGTPSHDSFSFILSNINLLQSEYGWYTLIKEEEILKRNNPFDRAKEFTKDEAILRVLNDKHQEVSLSNIIKAEKEIEINPKYNEIWSNLTKERMLQIK